MTLGNNQNLTFTSRSVTQIRSREGAGKMRINFGMMNISQRAALRIPMFCLINRGCWFAQD